MELAGLFTELIGRLKLFSAEDKLLLAVSGGIDSVVLCDLCKAAGFHFIIAHCNFQLRGEESDRDEEFVKSLAQKYSVEFFTIRFDTEQYAKKNKLSTQVAARELRYNWFRELLTTTQSKWILTAHHADDNIETVLMNFFKGTGVSGLRGIPVTNRPIIRPLLSFRKSDLLAYAKSRQLAWVDDSSNQSDKYNRNAFRNKIIPLVSQLYPQVEENILANIDRFTEIETIYQQAIIDRKKRLVEQRGPEYFIPVLKLAKEIPLNSIVYEVFREFNFSPAQTPELIKLLNAESGKWIQSTSHRAIRHRRWLIVSPILQNQKTTIVIDSAEDLVETDQFNLLIQSMKWEGQPIDSSVLVAQLDAKLVQFPLILRKPKAGDYFYPLGMKKKKKISRFLIDQKLSKMEKENCWVIESAKRIVWVVGHRIDDRFKIRPQTKFSLVLIMKSK